MVDSFNWTCGLRWHAMCNPFQCKRLMTSCTRFWLDLKSAWKCEQMARPAKNMRVRILQSHFICPGHAPGPGDEALEAVGSAHRLIVTSWNVKLHVHFSWTRLYMGFCGLWTMSLSGGEKRWDAPNLVRHKWINVNHTTLRNKNNSLRTTTSVGYTWCDGMICQKKRKIKI